MKVVLMILTLMIGMQKQKVKNRLKQYENYETISSSRVPLTYKSSGDSVTINGNDMHKIQEQKVQEKAELNSQIQQILDRYQQKQPQSVQESQDRGFDTARQLKRIHKSIVFEPMSIHNVKNKDNVIQVSPDSNPVQENNYVKLSGDPEYFNNYYQDYFQKYYQNLETLTSPFYEGKKTDKINKDNIFRYFPLMYNVNYNDNLLQSSTTLFKVNENKGSGIQFLNKGALLNIPKAETIVLPILQPIIQTVPEPEPCVEPDPDCVCPEDIKNLENQLKQDKPCECKEPPKPKPKKKPPCKKKDRQNQQKDKSDQQKEKDIDTKSDEGETVKKVKPKYRYRFKQKSKHTKQDDNCHKREADNPKVFQKDKDKDDKPNDKPCGLDEDNGNGKLDELENMKSKPICKCRCKDSQNKPSEEDDDDQCKTNNNQSSDSDQKPQSNQQQPKGQQRLKSTVNNDNKVNRVTEVNKIEGIESNFVTDQTKTNIFNNLLE